MLILAFDTATDVAASALLDDDEVLGERWSSARTLLEDVDALLRQASARPTDLDALVVGTGPGSFTSTRMGLAFARGLGLALGIPGAGVSTLDALASAQPGACPVIDARRSEVFVEGPRAVAPDDLELQPGTLCVGSGAVRYRVALAPELEVDGGAGGAHAPVGKARKETHWNSSAAATLRSSATRML